MKRREKIKTKGIKCFTIALTFVMLFGAFNIFAPHVEATIQTKGADEETGTNKMVLGGMC